MKSIIYKNPVISAITINIVTLIIVIYGISIKQPLFTTLLFFVGIINRHILDNGQNVNKQKKSIVTISVIILVFIILAYSLHIHNVENMKIINGL